MLAELGVSICAGLFILFFLPAAAAALPVRAGDIIDF